VDQASSERRRERARLDWQPPGPFPPGLPDLVLPEGQTLDALCGHWRIFQLKKGHRYSTDDLLGAWFTCDLLEKVEKIEKLKFLEMGCGTGSIGMMVAWRFPAAHWTGVEIQPLSVGLARRSLLYNGLFERGNILEGDLKKLDLGSFELIIGSPPYWDPRSGIKSAFPQKAPCRFEETGCIEDYCEAAERHLSPGGILTLVFDGRQGERAEKAALSAGLKIFRRRFVTSREKDRPLIVLLGLSRAEVGIPVEDPPLLLRDRAGLRSEEFRAIRREMGFPPGIR
jgi:tRNA1(Val) A37 N6-methylase TrmN6